MNEIEYITKMKIYKASIEISWESQAEIPTKTFYDMMIDVAQHEIDKCQN
jgi:hypothetical protein